MGLELTEEYKKMLIGALPFDQETVTEYKVDGLFDEKKLPADLIEKVTPVVQLKAFKNKDKDNGFKVMGRILKYSSLDKESYLAQKDATTLLKRCVVGWENFLDVATGEYIDYSEENVSKFTHPMTVKVFLKACRLSGWLHPEATTEDVNATALE